jgi:retron-type reverse transcriptase
VQSDRVVPTVSDRIAQMVVKQLIEPDLDPIFLKDSYGYRPGKSALDAVGVTRERCRKYDWRDSKPPFDRKQDRDESAGQHNEPDHSQRSSFLSGYAAV